MITREGTRVYHTLAQDLSTFDTGPDLHPHVWTPDRSEETRAIPIKNAAPRNHDPWGSPVELAEANVTNVMSFVVRGVTPHDLWELIFTPAFEERYFRDLEMGSLSNSSEFKDAADLEVRETQVTLSERLSGRLVPFLKYLSGVDLGTYTTYVRRLTRDGIMRICTLSSPVTAVYSTLTIMDVYLERVGDVDATVVDVCVHTCVHMDGILGFGAKVAISLAKGTLQESIEGELWDMITYARLLLIQGDSLTATMPVSRDNRLFQENQKLVERHPKMYGYVEDDGATPCIASEIKAMFDSDLRYHIQKRDRSQALAEFPETRKQKKG